jgi:hypothetical protein
MQEDQNLETLADKLNEELGEQTPLEDHEHTAGIVAKETTAVDVGGDIVVVDSTALGGIAVELPEGVEFEVASDSNWELVETDTPAEEDDQEPAAPETPLVRDSVIDAFEDPSPRTTENSASAVSANFPSWSNDYPALYGLYSKLSSTLAALEAATLNSPGTAEAAEWGATLQGALAAGFHPTGGALDLLTERPAQWTNTPYYEGKRLVPTRGRPTPEGDQYVGDSIAARVAQSIGVGQTVTFPMWASGFYVTIKAPNNARLLQLERQISMNKDHLGYATSGMIYANDVAYSLETLVGYILQDIVDCNVQNWNPTLLKELILSPDVQVLALAYATAIYTNGFPFSQPCTAQLGKCYHTETTKLHLLKCLQVDESRLTFEQLKHMSSRATKHTVEQVRAYQEKHTESRVGTARIANDITVVFRVPTLSEYFSSAARWLDGIETSTKAAFREALAGQERLEYMKQQLQASLCRQYGHWVKEVIFDDPAPDGESTIQRSITVPESIDKAVDSFSASDDYTNVFIDGVYQYINDRTIALAAINNYKCPSCGNWHHTSHSNRLVLPIDAVGTFFTLMQFKLLQYLPN